MTAVAAGPSARSQVTATISPVGNVLGGRLSTTRTIQPADAKCSTRYEPISPELPVTRMARFDRSNVNAPRVQHVPYRPLAGERGYLVGGEVDPELHLQRDDELHVLQRVPSGALRENGLVVDWGVVVE